MAGELGTAADVAKLTTIAEGTWYAWRSKGRTDVPTGFKLGARVVWDMDEVRAWIKAQREASS